MSNGKPDTPPGQDPSEQPGNKPETPPGQDPNRVPPGQQKPKPDQDLPDNEQPQPKT